MGELFNESKYIYGEETSSPSLKKKQSKIFNM